MLISCKPFRNSIYFMRQSCSSCHKEIIRKTKISHISIWGEGQLFFHILTTPQLLTSQPAIEAVSMKWLIPSHFVCSRNLFMMILGTFLQFIVPLNFELFATYRPENGKNGKKCIFFKFFFDFDQEGEVFFLIFYDCIFCSL